MVILMSKMIAKKFGHQTGIETISLNEYSKLDSPVNSHADMLLCVIDNTIFCYDEYYKENPDIFAKIKKYNVLKSSHNCISKYPYDIGLNVLVVGKCIFCKKKYTAKEILNYAALNNYKVIDVNQGYSCCSTLVLDKNSAITSDTGIYNALISEGIDALLVSTKNIKLDGYNCGFVGGSGCVLDKNVYFFGDISRLDDYEEIVRWLELRNYKFLPIISGDVYDFGGAKVLK